MAISTKPLMFSVPIFMTIMNVIVTKIDDEIDTCDHTQHILITVI